MQENLNQIETLVATLEHQNEIKKDYVAPASSMFFADGKLVITREDSQVLFTPSSLFHQQMSDYLSIPKAYYDRLKDGTNETIKLLDENVNHWLARSEKSRLVRTFENENNTARAFLSDNYNMIDNYEVLFEALAAIRETGLNIDVNTAELSETRMYLKITCPDVEVSAKSLLERYARTKHEYAERGYGVIAGFVLSNSEVGRGSFQIAPRALVRICNNGLINTGEALKRVHLGSKMDAMFEDSKNVRAANVRLIKEQLKHAIKVFMSKAYVEKLVNLYSELGEKEIAAPVAGVVEVVAKNYSLSQERKNSILNYFIKAGDSRRIGMVHAITEELQTLSDADQKHDGEVMALDMLQNFDKIESAAMKTKFSAS